MKFFLQNVYKIFWELEKDYIEWEVRVFKSDFLFEISISSAVSEIAFNLNQFELKIKD